MNTHKIAVIAGDGIGPEVIAEGIRVLEEAAKLDGVSSLSLRISRGGANITAKQEE